MTSPEIYRYDFQMFTFSERDMSRFIAEIETQGSVCLNRKSTRAKRSPRRWEWANAHEIRHCCPVGEDRILTESHLTKAQPAGQ